ncbi:Cystatin-A3 [Halotydeus destructor]|nr:Cystatin-A3 [Halotydeus destructor]
MPGGVGEAKEIDETAQSVCDQVRSEVEAKTGRKFTEFQPLSFKQQLVNGVNYFIKVKVDNGEHLHVRAHRAFQGDVTLHSVQENKKLEDEITHF